jgi:signal transduction histidine kinase
LGVIFLFVLVSYLAFSASRKAEQNQVWVGMSKETAHQLGTPISSLMAWLELLKQQDTDQELLTEIEKDITRLEVITERFSKIGSVPNLQNNNINEILNQSIQYFKKRTSGQIVFVPRFNDLNFIAPVNPALFQWVVENLFKNAIDAMRGVGKIEILLSETPRLLLIDISDEGKGIAKSRQKAVFQPGYTTKDRGWGLGLSLSKRIIEEYHSGKIFVKQSDIGKGTTFRIQLNKQSQNEN